MSDNVTVFEAVGGAQFFVDLVERFYAGVADDDLLSPMYPEDLTGAKAHLSGFLVQYWGGPTTYSDERGHPRLRMRHSPFQIGVVERDAWHRHMTAAVEGSGAAQEVKDLLNEYFDSAATAMVNYSQ